VAEVRRTLLGRHSGATSQERVFLTSDAIEVEEAEGYDVSRRRVFFDEVLLVTYHQTAGVGFVVAMVVFMTLFGFIGLLTLVADARTGGIVLALLVLPFVVALVLRLALKLDVITVHGRRTKAELRFWFRKGRAQQVYQRITRLVRARQQRLRAARPVRRPPPPPRMPPPPPPEEAPS
jgi:hypothetical protein